MIIKLKHPFNSLYKKGYLRSCPDGRKRVDLFNSNNDRTTISYSRYLASVKEGRILSKNEEVDHDDNDRTNDSLSNLVVLTVEEHKKKTKANRKPQVFLNFVCPVCGREFQRRKGLEGKSSSPKCSRRCNGLSCPQSFGISKIF